MQPDLILKNANIANGPTGVDIACQNGKIIEIAEHIDVPSVEVLDCGGMLVSPPLSTAISTWMRHCHWVCRA